MSIAILVHVYENEFEAFIAAKFLEMVFITQFWNHMSKVASKNIYIKKE